MQKLAFSPARPAHVILLLPARGGDRWHDELAQRVTERYGAIVHRVVRLADSQPEQVYDILLDLSEGCPGMHAPIRARRRLAVLCGEQGQRLDPQLLMGKMPWLAIAELESRQAPPQVLADSCIALPQWGGLSELRHRCEDRLTQLILRALDALVLGRELPARNSCPQGARIPAWLAWPHFALARGFSRTRNVFRKPFVHTGQWRLATRIGGAGPFHPWPVEPDRFLADPFLIREKGAVYLFCEEYTHDTGRGSIVWSRFEVAARGWSVPRSALVRPWHLSYPFVFRGADGQIYMLPEQGSTGVLTLYQADRFPDRWQPVVDLLTEDGITDATLYRDAQGWWLFCGRGWDELFLYHAAHLRGPYRPHPQNPVKSDARSARPGGRLYRDDEGLLIRPAQDCSRGYGGAVSLCRVDELTPKIYRETVIERLSPRLIPGASGVHSYDRLGDIEVIDGKTTIQRRHWDFGALAGPLVRRGQQDLQIAR